VQDLSDLSVVISDVEIRLGKWGGLTGLASLTCHDEGDDPEEHMHGVREISHTDAYTGPSQVLFRRDLARPDLARRKLARERSRTHLLRLNVFR
jgi:hypothetical protein